MSTVAYKFRVRASNAKGTSAWSAWSARVTLRAAVTGALSVSPLVESSLTQPVAMISDGTDLWVANESGGLAGSASITKISLATHQATVLSSPLLNYVTDLASNGTDLFITGPNSNAWLSGYVVEMDIATGVFSEIDSATFADPTAIVATSTYAYTINANGGPYLSGSLSQIDLATRAVTEIDSPLFNSPDALALSPGALWVADLGGGPANTGSLLDMNLSTAVVSEVDNPAFNNPSALAADSTQVVVLNSPAAPALASLSVLTIASRAVATDANSLLASVSGIALDASNVWVVSNAGGTYGDGSLVEISRSSGALSVVNSSLFVTPSLVATGSGRAYVIGSTTFQGFFGGTSLGVLVEIEPNGAEARYGPGPLPPSNPVANLVTNPQYNGTTCTQSSNYVYTVSVACTDAVLQAINNAHLAEHIKPMVLPTNWNSLSVSEQIFVAVDLERIDRGLPAYLGINAALSANAQAAAVLGQDPSLAKGFADAFDPGGYVAVGGVWAGDYSPLSADFGWLYSDGWGGSQRTTNNFDCTSARAAACWGHRDQLLGSDPGYNPGVGLHCTTCEMGVGYSLLAKYHWGSYVGLIERPAAGAPAMIFTWAHDVVPHLPVQ